MRKTINLGLAILLAAGSASALAKDHGNGNGNGNGHGNGKGRDKQEARGAGAAEVREGGYFTERQREAARARYSASYGGAKHCPPGLAKKNNGCLPPGQARKWAVGQPIPSGVTVYAVPQPVLVALPPAPVGFRYARLGGDVLLVRISGNVVVDIMVDIFR